MRLTLIQYSPLQQQPKQFYASAEVLQGQNDTKEPNDLIFRQSLV